jgi:hypothetical protein
MAEESPKVQRDSQHSQISLEGLEGLQGVDAMAFTDNLKSMQGRGKDEKVLQIYMPSSIKDRAW